MLRIKSIQLQQFKNYDSARVTLGEQVNCFTGNNGAGKTNLLDAVYYLSFTKSFFNALDSQNVQHGAEYFSVQAKYDRNGHEEDVLLVLQKGKKTLKVNNNEVKKLSAHIGEYPLVMITPNDIMLLHEGSEERRKFMDGIISQTDKVYLNDLLLYNRALEHRNKLLRVYADEGYVDEALLETYNDLLVKHGAPVYAGRAAFMEAFIPVFVSFYQRITNANEAVSINYQSDLQDKEFAVLLRQQAHADQAAQRTTKGVHKDELEFLINGFVLKKFGSQGQQKSFIIALKLAQYEYLKQKTQTKPLLLLDDIFEKLDQQRLQTLLEMISHDEFGQILITDTHLERLKEVFSKMPTVDVKYFMVENGTINQI